MGDNMKYKKYLPLLVLLTFISSFFITNRTISVFENSDYVPLPVIMYHGVNKNPSRSCKYVITPEKLEEDLKYLQDKGYTGVSVKDIIKYVNLSEPLPDKPVLITFDDGMYNNMSVALPVLEKYNFNAVFSVVGSYTDEYTKSDITNNNYGYLRWCDIKELSDNPLIEFGSHSYNFHNISKERYGTKKKSYEKSLDYINTFYQDTQKLQSEFLLNCNYKPIIYTYPFGSFSSESYKVLKKMGFLVSFSCTQGINKLTHDSDCLYMLKRYNRDGTISTWEFFSKLKL